MKCSSQLENWWVWQSFMGLIYRKSMNLGPFRVNLSKSGIGFSVGGSGFRTGVSSRGRKYTSVGLPGIGLSYRMSTGGKAAKNWIQKITELFVITIVLMKGGLL